MVRMEQLLGHLVKFPKPYVYCQKEKKTYIGVKFHPEDKNSVLTLT